MMQRGQSMVEFALSSVVLLLLVGGLVDIGRAVSVQEVLSSAAREGARHGAWFGLATSFVLSAWPDATATSGMRPATSWMR